MDASQGGSQLDSALEVRNVELFEEMLLSEGWTPRRFIISGFFWCRVEYLSNLLKLLINEFGRTVRWLVIVERDVDAAFFESVQPP